MQLRQLGDKHCQKRGGVENKVCWIVLCVETCQKVPAGEKGTSLADDTLIDKHQQSLFEKGASVIRYILLASNGYIPVSQLGF